MPAPFADLSPADVTAAARTLAKLDTEHLILAVLLQMMLIIAAARLFGVLARKVGQPTVVGEIVAGLLLGPSLFGWLAPEWSAAIFRPHLEGVPQPLADAAFPKIFTTLAQLGLILLLFLIGLEFEFSHLRTHGRAALLISAVGVALPFALGAGLAPLVHPHLEPHPDGGPVPVAGLTLFLGVAMSITAIPILGRMMIELGIHRTRLGAITITAAAVDDAAGWTLLATVAAVVKSDFDPLETARMVGLTVAFLGVMLYVVRPLLVRYYAWSLRANDGRLSLNALAVTLVALFGAAVATNRIGIFAIFGAFVLGAVLSDQDALRRAVTDRVRDFVTGFFLPVFFTYTGLRTEIGSLAGATMWLICGAVLSAAVVGKFVGCGVAARVSGFPPREAAIIGVMMNTRALMELIVINVGYELKVIPKSLFTMLVIMAVTTTVVTTPVLLRLRRGTEIDEPIRRSGFLGGRPPAPEVAGREVSVPMNGVASGQ